MPVPYLLRSVTIIPGTTEFGYATSLIGMPLPNSDTEIFPLNSIRRNGIPDFILAINDLKRTLPNVRHVSLVVAWHGTDLRIGQCQVIPKTESPEAYATQPYIWAVGRTTKNGWLENGIRGNLAEMVSKYEERPAAGGAPADRSVYEAIVYLKKQGYLVTLYPFILMDIPQDNELPNPYDLVATRQPAYPWRGRITCDPAPGNPLGTVDQTQEAAAQVASFFGDERAEDYSWDAQNLRVIPPTQHRWSFRNHILHLATIAAAAGSDDFLIGTEMVEMTRIRDGANSFPAVQQLMQLATDVRSIVGPDMKLSYAADWSEYHSYKPDDGSGDVYFNLDPLWAHPEIDYIGIDNYLPISDWRDGFNHLDALAGWPSIYDQGYLQGQVQGGELYDYFYASSADRWAQVRTPISDFYGRDWVYRQKDIPGWWSAEHVEYRGGEPTGDVSPWVPESKPVVFTELGCSSASRGTNQPNVFVDPKSSESFWPYHSEQVPDQLIQLAYLEATHTFWFENNPRSTVYNGPMLDTSRMSVWTWDARPFPEFPDNLYLWVDGENWETGHWITGKLEGPDMASIFDVRFWRNFTTQADDSAFFADEEGWSGATRVWGRLFVGDGADFDGNPRGENSNLDAWVHTGDEGTNIFLGTTSVGLSATLLIGSTVASVTTIEGLPASGHIKIGDEIIGYTGLSGGGTPQITGLVRGQFTTTAAEHAALTEVFPQAGPYGSRIQYAQTQARAAFITREGLAVSGAAINEDGQGLGGAFFGRQTAGGRGNVWALYSEAIRGEGTLGARSIWGMEIGVMNFAGDMPAAVNRTNRPSGGKNGQTLGLMIQAGGGNVNAFNASNPLAIGKGAKSFWGGVVFYNESVQPAVGGIPEALLLPRLYAVSWYDASGDNRTAMFFSEIDDAANAQRLILADQGLRYVREDGAGLFGVDFVADAVNSITLRPSATGAAVEIAASGSDTDIDLMLRTKGAGVLRYMQVPSAGSISQTHYWPVKDLNGTTFYLMLSNATP